MGAAMSLNIAGQRFEVVVEPKLVYVPARLSIRGDHGTVELHADDEQLQEIEQALRDYRINKIRKEEIA